MENYPNEFVLSVIKEYGDDSKVSHAALLGNFGLGNLLSQGVNIDFCPEDVIQLLEEDKSEEVLQKARSCINRRKLHKEWLSIMMDRIRSIEMQSHEVSDNPSPSKRSNSINPQFLATHS